MKDQYFGDINDYRKYGLLRAISDASALPFAVCWLRTAADGRRDGEFRSYLRQPDRWRRYDPELYDRLRLLLDPDTPRSTQLAESWGLLPGAVYQQELLGDQVKDRVAYFEATWGLAREVPLVFFDPDNGVEVPSVPWGRKGSSKYVYWRELQEATTRGHTVLLYQHFPRRPRATFIDGLARELASRLGTSSIQVFRSAHVAFFLIAQERHRDALEPSAALVADRWGAQFHFTVHDVA